MLEQNADLGLSGVGKDQTVPSEGLRDTALLVRKDRHDDDGGDEQDEPNDRGVRSFADKQIACPTMTTYAANTKKVTATARRVRSSWSSSASPCRSRAAKRSPTSTAAADSMPLSRPKPTSDTRPARSPAVTATMPSIT